MCLSIPRKVVKINEESVTVDDFGKEKKVNGKIIDVEKGDYVVINNGIIMDKIDKKKAENFLKFHEEK